ncbi:hypothetical protein MD535_23805 [Vibrio sp. ZSDZ65]|uniref:Filamentation induced by cAMP protein Fic-like C-terminal domain-containing protein n=1 Tax=Vibrio qingdaonensis TaxID=2829491 RepID=A0A9X3CV38_9VIBR|nr:hypothetical protein [Vibrio qingdaonensis]MCW8349020.1 hypothetical protein [Vibrio qingdaonensis]
MFAYVSVETVIREEQEAYYQTLSESDKRSEVTPFIAFMLNALFTLLKERQTVLMETIGIKHRPTFKKNYLSPAIEVGLVEMSNPEKPRSPNQLYRLTALGRKL